MKIKILSVLVRYMVTAALDIGGMMLMLSLLSASMMCAVAYAIATQQPEIILWLRDHTLALVLCAIIVALVNVSLWYATWSRRVSRAAADRLIRRREA